MNTKILIPKKCKVGFNGRSDTYTGKLGYVIYHDGKVWRKETSWEGWRHNYMSNEDFLALKIADFNKKREERIKWYEDEYKRLTNILADPKEAARKYAELQFSSSYNAAYYKTDKYLDEQAASYKKNAEDWFSRYPNVDAYHKYYSTDKLEKHHFNIPNRSSDPTVAPVEFENTLREGFVLNKKAGGGGSGWDARETKCRVYDPLGFEFEISIPNLLYILENTNSIKGKGLEGKFIYGWEGKELILVPEDAPEYKEMMKFTAVQDLKVSSKDLVEGRVYTCKDARKAVYLGRHPEWNYTPSSSEWKTTKKYWFYYLDGYPSGVTTRTNVSQLASEDSTEIHPQYAEFVDKMEHLKAFTGVKGYALRNVDLNAERNKKPYYKQYFFEHENRIYQIKYSNYHYGPQFHSVNLSNTQYQDLSKGYGDQELAKKFDLPASHSGVTITLEQLKEKLNLKEKVTILKNGKEIFE